MNNDIHEGSPERMVLAAVFMLVRAVLVAVAAVFCTQIIIISYTFIYQSIFWTDIKKMHQA